MGHDVYFKSKNDELEGCYLKVNGCEQALANLITDENIHSDIYNRTGEFLLNKESILKFIQDVRQLDWNGEEIPDWIEEQLANIEKGIMEFDFDNHSLFIYTQ